ncbi:MAG: hypothetical protein PVJ86_00350 [Phycisphaerales bacterium]|jgi:hypothetical protein
MALTAQQLIDGIAAAGIDTPEAWTAIMTRLKLRNDLSKIDSAIARERAAQNEDDQTHEAALQALQAQKIAIQAEIDALEA